MNKVKTVIIGIICAVLLCIIIGLAANRGNNAEFITEETLSPFFAESVETIELEELEKQNGGDYTNYYMQASLALTAITKEKHIDEAREIIDCLEQTFDRYGYFPRPAYQSFEYGWVSCMDAPVVAIAAYLYDEKCETDRYEQFINDIVEYIPKDVKEHGFVANIEGESWLFEYAETDTDASNGEFVLNGSLAGTLATAMLARITNNDMLNQLVASQTRLYKQMRVDYYTPDESWSYYMLKPKYVNQPHYMIFEIRLLDSLTEVTGDTFFKEEADHRRDLLKDYYKLFLYEKNGDTFYRFIRGGAPHYYYIDIYQTELVFYDEKGNVLAKECFGGRNREDSIVEGVYPKGTKRVEWIVAPPAWTVSMGDLDIEHVNAHVEWKELSCDYSSSESGHIVGNCIRLKKTTDRCSLLGKFENAVKYENDDIFAIEIFNPSDISFSTNIILYENDEKAVDRYLLSIEPGENVLMFSMPGFVSYNEQALLSISSFCLRIYLSNMQEKKDVELKLGKLYQFNNAYEWSDYCKTIDNRINWGP